MKIRHNNRVLTTLSDSPRTPREIPEALVSLLTREYLHNHTGDDGEHISDMETRITVESDHIFGWKRDIFFLEDSVLYHSGFHQWYLINVQGQRIAFNEYKDSFRWCENVLDENGESDYFSEVYDFKGLMSTPTLELLTNKDKVHGTFVEATYHLTN